MGATFKDLPAEIIQLIMHHSIPLPAYSTFPRRYECLLRYSLVAKQWTALAQHILFSQLHLPSPAHVDAYLTATCAYDEPSKTWGPTPRGLRLADLAKGVWFGGGRAGRISGTGETERMMKVLVLVVNVRVVWAQDLMPFALEHLSALKGEWRSSSGPRSATGYSQLTTSSLHFAVERLHLDRIKMITPYKGTPRLLLPHLKQLHLSASCVGLVDLATGGLHADSPTGYITNAFPPLEAITIDRSFQFEPSGDVAPIQLPLPGTEPAVKALRIDPTLLTEEGEPVTDWQALLPLFTSLKRLAVSDPANLLELSAALPPAATVTTLEVLLPHALAGPTAPVDEINYDIKIMSALLSDAPGLKRLQRVVVSVCVDGGSGEAGEGAAGPRRVGDGRTRANLAGRCQQMRIELVERPFGPDGDENRLEWIGVEDW